MATATVDLSLCRDRRVALAHLTATRCTADQYAKWEAQQIARDIAAAVQQALATAAVQQALATAAVAAPDEARAITFSISKTGQIVLRGVQKNFPLNIFPTHYYRIIAEWAAIDTFIQQYLAADWTGEVAEKKGGPKQKVTRRLSEKSPGLAARYRDAALAAMQAASNGNGQ